jgi:hypothetical protein
MMAYVRCLNNQGYEASLTVGKVYKILPTSERDTLRVIDNEGEDYLYDKGRFEPLLLNEDRTPEALTVHLDNVTKGILHAEALAAQKSISALLREWIDERLDLPVATD